MPLDVGDLLLGYLYTVSLLVWKGEWGEGGWGRMGEWAVGGGCWDMEGWGGERVGGMGEGWRGEGREGTDVLVTNTIYGERSVACAVQHITHCS